MVIFHSYVSLPEGITMSKIGKFRSWTIGIPWDTASYCKSNANYHTEHDGTWWSTMRWKGVQYSVFIFFKTISKNMTTGLGEPGSFDVWSKFNGMDCVQYLLDGVANVLKTLIIQVENGPWNSDVHHFPPTNLDPFQTVNHRILRNPAIDEGPIFGPSMVHQWSISPSVHQVKNLGPLGTSELHSSTAWAVRIWQICSRPTVPRYFQGVPSVLPWGHESW